MFYRSRRGQKRMRIVRYLLGNVSENERVEIERGYFADTRRLDEVCEVETELIDLYARGRLSNGERGLFETHYLTSETHRRRLAFAETLLEAVDPAAKAEPVELAPRQRFAWSRLFHRAVVQPAWPSALAVAVLLVLSALCLLLFERDRSSPFRSQDTPASGHAAVVREPAATAAAESTQPKNEGAPPPKVVAQNTSSARAVGHRRVLSFFLSPVMVRSAGGPHQITVPRKTETVRLLLRSKGDPSRKFEAIIRTVEGEYVWTEAKISPPVGGEDQSLVPVLVPSSKLASGDYVLALSGVDSAGGRQELARYFFRIEKRP
jgi:hypothetical protein